MRSGTRVAIAAICVAFACLCAVGCAGGTAPSEQQASKPAARAKREPVQRIQPAPVPMAAEVAQAKPLGEYTDRHGFRRTYFQVPMGLSDAQLIDLARHLHAQEKDAWLWLLDSDEQARGMLDALPATERGDLGAYPGQWVEAHTVAHSTMQIVPGGGQRWTLYKGPYSATELAVLGN